jgi:hypothetical protein
VSEKSKTQYVLDKLELQLAEEINRVTPIWEYLTEYEKSRLNFLELVVKLGHRNKTIAKLLYLQNFYVLTELSKDLEAFKPKRGKDNKKHFPLKLVMEVLGCSHRQAQVYLLYMKGTKLADKVFDDLRKAATSNPIE